MIHVHVYRVSGLAEVDVPDRESMFALQALYGGMSDDEVAKMAMGPADCRIVMIVPVTEVIGAGSSGPVVPSSERGH